MHVIVSCITYRRPEGLKRLLKGLNALRFSRTQTPEITVLIVNNAPDEPISTIVEEIRTNFRWRLSVDEEPCQGVSSARNKVLDLLPDTADLLSFIDDDEVPSPEWLDELLHVQRTSGASIVQGPVEPIFCPSAPEWIINGRFFQQGPYEDGASLHFAATNNSLIDIQVIRSLGLRFDQRFNRTGGEDQHFFGRAIKAGFQVVTAQNAVVMESIPKSRANIGYLIRRHFRMGTTLTMIDRIDGRPGWQPIRLIKGSGRMILGLSQTLLYFRDGRAAVAKALTNIAWGAGSIAMLFNFAYFEYSPRKILAQTSENDSTVR